MAARGNSNETRGDHQDREKETARRGGGKKGEGRREKGEGRRTNTRVKGGFTRLTSGSF